LRCTYPRGHVHHKLGLEILSLLLSIVGASSRVRSLVVAQPHKLQPMRPQLHTIVRSSPGQFKSTILDEIGRKFGISVSSNVTFPAMIGTVDQGKLVHGLVWTSRKKPMLLDEFRTGERGDSLAVDALLGTMESGHYKRKIGLQTPYYFEQDSEDPSLFYKVENGEFEVQTRFSAIIATMKNWDKARGGKYAALTQRCIPIPYRLDDDTIDAVLDGKVSPYTNFEFNPPEHGKVCQKDYKRIRELAAGVRDSTSRFRAAYTRAIGDLCRVRAVIGRVDPELFLLICYLKAGLPLEQALRSSKES